MNINARKKVLVAMSGGVDSSVAAALLKQQGYFVVGGFMKNFSPEAWSGVIDSDCPWEQDQEDVAKVCKVLGIEYRSFNFENDYKEKVIEYFFSEYAEGRTPNPDIMCNKEIKFRLFLDKANDLGFDYIATGHYVKKIKRQKAKPVYELLKGVDESKDQSYFLYALNQDQLAKSLFPVGEYQKSEIRALARKFNLPNADKKDSQGLCFVGHINLQEFLKQRIPEKVGQIVTTAGEVLGEHRGAAYYTIGQRHGLKIGGGTPYFVVDKNVMANKLTVAKGGGDPELYATELALEQPHWIDQEPNLSLNCQAKIRYRQRDQKATLRKDSEGYKIKFRDKQFAPASGQSVVFYDHDRVLGGAVIS